MSLQDKYKIRAGFLRSLRRLEGKVSFNVPMRRHTTMRVGGRCFALYEPDSIEGIKEAIRLCKRAGISFLAIGGGSNIIFNDNYLRRLIIRLSSPFFKRIEISANSIGCGAGARLSGLIRKAEDNLLGGVEFLVGIPGTVGGAIKQNAGAFGSSISDIVKDIKALDRNGSIKVLKKRDLRFGYRSYDLKGSVILGATFKLKKKSKAGIGKDISNYLAKRLSTQDYTAPSAGCIFKNPKKSRMSAGEMIDRCGLKGKNIGGAYVSERHANFIINKKKAKAADILRLIALIKKNVRERFGVSLEEEVLVI